jgi:diguanylate cyclase (GGDEF)-like protein
MSVATSTLDRLVAQAGDLYSLPAVAMEILELASDAKADARKLKECIERDPALTTKILRVVNSSLFGLAQQVSDLNQALALLGMKPLKLLVLGFSLPDALFQNVAGEMLSRYWQRTLVKSIAAREISERIRSDLGDEAFIAGLLQDIGQLVLIQCVGEPYIQFVGKARGEPGDLKRLERRALGFDHVQLSAELLNRWGLPGLIVEAVAGLESSETIARTSNPLIRVLDLAELVATLLCDGHTVVLAELGERVGGSSVFSRSWLDELVISLQEKVGQLAGVLSLELPPGTDYRDVLARSREQMSHVASEVVGDLLRERYSRHSSTCDDLNDELRLSVEAKALQAAVEAAACGMDAGLGRSLSAGTVCGDLRSAALAGPGMPLEIAAHTLETDSLVGRLRAHVLTSRQHRTPLSLLLIEVDHYTQVIFNCGATGAQQLFDQFQRLCEMLDVEGVVCVPLHEAGFAVILPDCDRAHAVRVGNQLVREARELRLGPANSHRSTMTVSVGAATVTLPPRNFQAEELVQRADRCLYGARASGGDVLKSIEIY